MTTLREAAQQALEALKDCVKALDALHAPGDSIYTRASDSADRAEIALRDALAAEEQEPAIYPDEAREMGLEEVALYTHPPRREWQGLTEEEMHRLQRDALLEALRSITAIEDQMYGPDWEEIEQARSIARAAIKAVEEGQ